MCIWLVLAHHLLEGRRKGHVTINNILLIFNIKQIDFMLPWICTVCNRTQKKLECRKDISDTIHYTSSAIFLFLPHFYFLIWIYFNWYLVSKAFGKKRLTVAKSFCIMEISFAFPMKHFAYQCLFSGESVLAGWTRNKKTKIEKKGKKIKRINEKN